VLKKSKRSIRYNAPVNNLSCSSLVFVFYSCAFWFCLSLVVGPADAAIVATGDVDPTDPATWTSSTTGCVGKTGKGTMSITSGCEVNSNDSCIGYESGSTGQVTVDGLGSNWTVRDNLSIGNKGNGTVYLNAGGVVSCEVGYVGYEVGSTGEVTVSGDRSTWTNSSALYVGYGGEGR